MDQQNKQDSIFNYDFSNEFVNINSKIDYPQVSNSQQLIPIEKDEKNLELKKKEEELKKKEEELKKREAELSKNEVVKEEIEKLKKLKPNFPFFYPLIRFSYFDIKTKFSKIVFILGSVAAAMFCLTLILNLIIAFSTCLFFQPIEDKEKLGNSETIKFLFMAILMIFISVPCHIIFSYYVLYKALVSTNIFAFLFFFVSYGVAIVFCLFNSLGYNDLGACGFLLALRLNTFLGHGNFYGFVFNVLMWFLWLFMSLFFVIILILVIYLFYKQNYTFKKAKDILTSSIVKQTTSTLLSKGFDLLFRNQNPPQQNQNQQ